MKFCASLCALTLISLQMACTAADDPATTPTTTVTPVFSSGQAASIVMGQTSMTSSTSGIGAGDFTVPVGVSVSAAGAVYVSERNNMRIMVYPTAPTANGASATMVLGQTVITTGGSGGTAANQVNQPVGIATSGTQFFVADSANHRVQIFNTIATNASASFAVGQANPATATDPAASVTATTMRFPSGVFVSGTKMVIADRQFNRILLYNTIPTANQATADLALGQANLTSSASSAATMTNPENVWTNGTKIVACEINGHRCLIWNTWPATSGTAPDIVLGQSSLATNSQNNGGLSASSMSNPAGITSDGTTLVISDNGNNRVLMWKTWPTANKQAADLVFGQPDFVTATSGLTASKLSSPNGVFLSGSTLYVADAGNNRVLLFKKQ